MKKSPCRFRSAAAPGLDAWVAEQLLARVDEATRGVASPLAALEAAFAAHVEFVVLHPGVPRMLFSELQRAEDTAAAVTQLVGTIQGLVIQSLLAGDPGRIRSGAPAAFALYRRGIRRSR